MDTASPGPSIQLQRAPKPFQKLHRGQPKALGVVLLMLAAVEFLFGFPVHYGAKSFLTGLGTPWWVAVLFVVSGCLAIVCEEAPNKPRVTACLAVNIVNAVGTSTGIINCCFDLAFWTANIVPESSEYNNHLVCVGYVTDPGVRTEGGPPRRYGVGSGFEPRPLHLLLPWAALLQSQF
ncbi:membrane-spanning 4-domains subfamily A member 4A-like isoform X2 [Narcine bancroftii]|uniref:membrane-spanning 4-domains subfamily A member 4A-like isoform X2 n=1 Tax=Narcine bancroftii TaxID=1343680 RepID=UPI003831B9BD